MARGEDSTEKQTALRTHFNRDLDRIRSSQLCRIDAAANIQTGEIFIILILIVKIIFSDSNTLQKRQTDRAGAAAEEKHTT